MIRAVKAAIILMHLASLFPGIVRAGDLRGLVTQVEEAGESIQLSGPGADANPLAKPWQVVRQGTRFTIPKGARVGVVCSTRSFVRIEGPASWSLNEKTCALGKPLTPAAYTLIVPQGGRLKVVHGALGLEQEVRGDDEDVLAPLVLGPRNTASRTLHPSIAWLRVPAAVEYQIEWSGRGDSPFTLRLDVKNVLCAAGWEGLDICSLPWPAGHSDLAPGQTYFLKISARDGIVAQWHESRAVEIRILRTEELGTLEARLRDLDGLDLGKTAHEAASAGLLAETGLVAESAERYRRVLAWAPSAELEVTLSDVYLKMGLFRLAESHYKKALDSGDCGVRAATAFGLGRIEYSLANYSEASIRFREAVKIYAQTGLSEEEAAARKAAAKAEDRIPK
jgi:hypothetical protein